METVILGLIIIFVIASMWRNLVSPFFYMKRIEKNRIDDEAYCLIDVRDFITFYRSPTDKAKNIPLSYLPREVRGDAICDKEVVVIADGTRAAKMAARIINKQIKKPIYYVTI